MKDFYDIWIVRNHNINSSFLVEAIKKTFEKRRTPLPSEKKILPEIAFALNSEMQKKWGYFIKKRNLQNIPGQLRDIATEIESFFENSIKEINKEQGLAKETDIEFEMN